MFSGSNQLHVATVDIATEPATFFKILSVHGIGYVFAPNFFLAAATKAFKAQQDHQPLDFTRLAVVMTGGEANKVSTIAAADKLLLQYGARPNSIKSSYGLSEVSIEGPVRRGLQIYDNSDAPYSSITASCPRLLLLTPTAL